MEHHHAWRFFDGIILLLLYASLATARRALTLQKIIQIALVNNKDLNAARYNVAIAKSRWIQADLWPNPSLNLSNNNDRLFNGEGEYLRSAGFSQVFSISGHQHKCTYPAK